MTVLCVSESVSFLSMQHASNLSDSVNNPADTALNRPASALLFGLHDRPPPVQTALAALAHLLAIVAGIATAPLLIALGLGLNAETTAYVISSALIVSGIATFIQINRIGFVGSGLLSIQGTSFSFIGAVTLAGAVLAERGLADGELVGVILGSSAVGALCTIIAGYYIQGLSRVITQNVTGIAIFLLGLTLVGTAWNNLQFSVAQAAASGGNQQQVWIQAVLVIAVIGACSWQSNPWVRLASISIGLAVGMGCAWLMGDLALAESQGLAHLQFVRPLPFELGFDLGVCLLLLPIYFVTMTESLGDLTATSMLSGCETSGPRYWERVRGGVIAGGVNSVLAALVGSFPSTTFSQNNGVIQLTGVASRYVGLFVAGMLVLLGAWPVFTALFQSIPGGVLHGATGLLFAMIALVGWRLINMQPDLPRARVMLLVCTLTALALSFLPALLTRAGFAVPEYLAMLLNFPVATGALLAVGWETVRFIRD